MVIKRINRTEIENIKNNHEDIGLLIIENTQLVAGFLIVKK